MSKSSVVCQRCGLGLSLMGKKETWRHNSNGQMGRVRCQGPKPVSRADYDAQNAQAVAEVRQAFASRVDLRGKEV